MLGHLHGRRQRGLGGVHQVVDGNIFLSCRTSFQPTFWREIDLKRLQAPQGLDGHPHGR